MIGALATHVTLGETIELRVDERRKFAKRFLLTITPGFQELCKFV